MTVILGDFVEPSASNARTDGDARVVVLPLNLIAQIVSHVRHYPPFPRRS